MEALFGAAILLPLICLGVMILTAVVVIFALRRGTQAINQQVQENTAVPENDSPADRWARGDLKSTPQPEKTNEPMKACPACGGENAAGSSSCTYCGRAL